MLTLWACGCYIKLTAFLLAQLPSLHSGAHSFLPEQNLTSESDQSFDDCCKIFTVSKLLDMFDNKTLNVQSTQEMLFPRLKCACVPARRALKLTSKVHFVLQARPNGLESIHLDAVYVLK